VYKGLYSGFYVFRPIEIFIIFLDFWVYIGFYAGFEFSDLLRFLSYF
jgi:hypothetical protein